MEVYVLSKQDLSILSICKISEYEINLDEETNAKSIFKVVKTEGLKKGNYLVVNGLYRQFLFLIDDVETEKGSVLSTITALDISNIFNRKVIEKNTDTMTTQSIEQFIANTMSENFVNSDDTVLNVSYIEIRWHTNTQGNVATNAENGLYNFHTFLTNCRQYKNICTGFKFEEGKLKIDIENREDSTELVDTTLPEVTDYNKVYDDDVTAKVTVYIREDGSEYNLYLKTDRTTTENKDDPNRAEGKVEVISVDTADMAREEALNVIKGNTYNHLVEFKIAKTSKLMDITKLYIGRNIRIRTDDDIYDSYISAITIRDENFVYFKSGNLRTTLIDKLKKTSETAGNKLDVSGGVITGNIKVEGESKFTKQPYLDEEKILKFHGDNTVGCLRDKANNDYYVKSEEYYRGKYVQRIVIAGNADTYYPVLFQVRRKIYNSFGFMKINISRGYASTAPDSWNTSTHKGGLTMSFLWTGDTSWGGNDHNINLLELHQQYSTMVFDWKACTTGFIVWLRGGTAEYFIDSDFEEGLVATVYLNGYTDSGGTTYSAKTGTPTGTNTKRAYLLTDNVVNNFSSTATNLPLSANQGRILALNRNVMTAFLTTDFTVATANSYLKLGLNSSIGSGNFLTFTGNGIKIGAGISKVLVSANVQLVPKTTGRVNHIRIVRNSDTGKSVAWGHKNASYMSDTQITIAPVLVNVSEGDILTIMYYTAKNDVIQGHSTLPTTSLTVQAIS